MMPDFPISGQIHIKVSGSSAVYAIFVIASLFLAIFGSSVQNVILMYVFTGIGLFLFITLIIIGSVLVLKKSDVFLFKEEKRVVVEHRYYKTIGGEIRESISPPIPPTKLLDGKKES